MRPTVASLALGAVASVAIIAFPVAGSDGDSMPTPSEDRTSAEALADAVRFRTTFGFEADTAYVLNAANDPDRYPNTAWGVPLSVAEADELARREQLQAAIAPAVAYAKAAPNYSGFYFDQPAGGIPHFTFTDTTGHSSEIESRLPGGTPYVIEQGRYTHRELDELVSEVDSDIPQLSVSGIWVTSIAVDPYDNSVLVGLDAASWPKRQLLIDRYGPAVTFRRHGPAVPDACTSMTACWPTKGGIRIYESDHTALPCTSGFIVRRLTGSQTLALLTAGHCLAITGGQGETWKHNSSSTIGTSSATYIWESFVFADAGLIDISASAVTAMNGNYRRYLADPSPIMVSNLTSTGANQFQDPGYSACRIGYGTGNRTCGSIYLDSVIRDSCVTGYSCRHLYSQWEVDFDSIGGDSGGPVVSGAVTLAYGIHVHSDDETDPDIEDPHGWYSTVDWIKYTLDVERGVDIEWCITGPC
jgi:hypothetical protein